MIELYLLAFGPLAVGLILGFAWWLIWGHKVVLPAGSTRRFALAAGLLALVSEATVRTMGVSILLPFDVPHCFWLWYDHYRYLIPLAIGIVGVVLLMFPIRSRRGQGTAELTRRTPASFIRARWLLVSGVTLALILVITLLAGIASRPESETGEYKEYWVEPGGQLGIGTTIYGWFYSVPALILTGALIAVAVTSTFFIARPVLAEDREGDIRERAIRTRNIFAALTGASLIHLGLIFHSLDRTASMRGIFPAGDGYVTITPPFSAFGPAFFGAGMLCAVLGAALWATVVFSAIPRRRQLSETNQS